ncbi:MAG: hypothetical protein NW200_04425 [Hyphomonadaceae bacterium]|nr:hypothetical protein [Hyphomonadaceae bacterium]
MLTPAQRRTPPASKFVVGQRVAFTPSAMNPRTAAAARFTVVRVLPGDGARHAYRIKSDAENYERVAEENQLAAPALDGEI